MKSKTVTSPLPIRAAVGAPFGRAEWGKPGVCSWSWNAGGCARWSLFLSTWLHLLQTSSSTKCSESNPRICLAGCTFWLQRLIRDQILLTAEPLDNTRWKAPGNWAGEQLVFVVVKKPQTNPEIKSTEKSQCIHSRCIHIFFLLIWKLALKN